MAHEVDWSPWQGRVDAAEGRLARRWHEVVRPLEAGCAPGAAFLGLASDIGVRRNQGRPGAAEGPAALRRALANLPARAGLRLYDAGTVTPDGEDLEGAQAEYGRRVAGLLEAGHLPVGLGGGHEIAWGSWQGLAASLEGPSEGVARPRIGILNLDAHFDLRRAECATSGTPFRQMAEDCARRGWDFRYAAFGISAFSNTEALFQAARDLKVLVKLDEDLGYAGLSRALAELAGFVGGVDHLYLTLCLDVLPASAVPGVSAPAARGVPLEAVETLLDAACATGRVRLVDLAELNPGLDEDGRSAKVAARLIGRMIAGIQGASPAP